MNKSEIKNQYNVVKIVSSKELLALSKVYKDNLETIIVMMQRKTNNPSKPPQWFLDYMDMFKVSFGKEIEQLIDKKISAFAKLNNLKV